MAITTFATYHLAEAPFNFNTSQIGNVFLVLLIGVLVSPIAGRYSDIFGRIKILFLGVTFLITGIFLTFVQSYVFVIIGMGFVTIGMFSVQSVTPTYIGELAPNDKATVAVLYQTFFYLGGCLGALVPSIVWEYYRYYGVATLCIVIIVVGITPLCLMNLKGFQEN